MELTPNPSRVRRKTLMSRNSAVEAKQKLGLNAILGLPSSAIATATRRGQASGN